MRIILISLLLLFPVTAFTVDINPATVVYITCEREGQPSRSGTGTIVDPSGIILTAKHVVHDSDSKCRGSREQVEEGALKSLIVTKDSRQYDAQLLKFIPKKDERFEYIRFSRLTQEMVGNDIGVFGFPANGTGEISQRGGVLSTLVTDKKGMVQTDAITTMGMSGGPVLTNTGKLIGLVGGAAFDVLGTPTDYRVLAIQEVANDLGLKEEDRWFGDYVFPNSSLEIVLAMEQTTNVDVCVTLAGQAAECTPYQQVLNIPRNVSAEVEIKAQGFRKSSHELLLKSDSEKLVVKLKKRTPLWLKIAGVVGGVGAVAYILNQSSDSDERSIDNPMILVPVP